MHFRASGSFIFLETHQIPVTTPWHEDLQRRFMVWQFTGHWLAFPSDFGWDFYCMCHAENLHDCFAGDGGDNSINRGVIIFCTVGALICFATILLSILMFTRLRRGNKDDDERKRVMEEKMKYVRFVASIHKLTVMIIHAIWDNCSLQVQNFLDERKKKSHVRVIDFSFSFRW
jgi:hypothetical protein